MKTTLVIIFALICLGTVLGGLAYAENQAFGLVYTDPTVNDNGDGTSYVQVGMLTYGKAMTVYSEATDNSNIPAVSQSLKKGNLVDFVLSGASNAAVATPEMTIPTCSTEYRVAPTDGPTCSDHRQPG